ncbi:NAD(P)H-hydrate dehydratase [Paenibacillus filicis]|uniref:Bifunctional NAD(P)H-hydrate repair enzyme n=1 Tax=Paenibacillus gyeongsangnamensis TaxID=3388067 RepID=A0ABT4QE74_9BACL|nr:NAD(P)H-hydrate dehydratase [Paenibacillus filicis]MCZ8515172.1 NAD(P)H-hydrate dehydratase [Paenibacillus filicis]
MYVVTAEEMRELDRLTIEQIGIPSLVLMENAGRAVAEEVFRAAGTGRTRWGVLVGKGNNGADGVVAARHLQDAGYDVQLLYVEDPSLWKGESAVQRDIAVHYPLRSEVYVPGAVDWSRFDGLIDALLGTGSRGAPRGPYAAIIEEANASGLPIAAVDIPSGLNANTGSLNKPCIHAFLTVALAFTKRGLEQFPGAEAAGQVIVRRIGIPGGLADKLGVSTFTLTAEEMDEKQGLDAFRKRRSDSHKGSFGHLLIAAGSRTMSGAGVLCTRAAIHGGCGLVTWALPDRISGPLTGLVPEAMLQPMEDNGHGGWSAVAAEQLIPLTEGKEAMVLGPGMGRWDGDTLWMRAVWDQTDVPLVVDADGLNMMASSGTKPWPTRKAPVILTPHPGEMARLAGLTTAEVQADRIGLVRAFAAERGVTLVLKGARTVIATPDGKVYINRTGNSGMAKGGSGDVLAGLIGSLLAQGLHPEQAAVIGVFLHGQAGDRAAADKPSYALTASDLITYL